MLLDRGLELEARDHGANHYAAEAKYRGLAVVSEAVER